MVVSAKRQGPDRIRGRAISFADPGLADRSRGSGACENAGADWHGYEHGAGALCPSRPVARRFQPMPEDQLPDAGASRARLVTIALRLVMVSVAFGALIGVISVTAGLRDHSLGVFGVGLGVLADVIGSAVLIWLTGLALYSTLGWWWADRIAALVVAAIAAVEAWRTAPISSPWRSRQPGSH